MMHLVSPGSSYRDGRSVAALCLEGYNPNGSERILVQGPSGRRVSEEIPSSARSKRDSYGTFRDVKALRRQDEIDLEMGNAVSASVEIISYEPFHEVSPYEKILHRSVHVDRDAMEHVEQYVARHSRMGKCIPLSWRSLPAYLLMVTCYAFFLYLWISNGDYSDLTRHEINGELGG